MDDVVFVLHHKQGLELGLGELRIYDTVELTRDLVIECFVGMVRVAWWLGRGCS